MRFLRATHPYVATDEGWLYLACIMDLASRRIVGWSMSKRIKADLVCEALKSAYWRRKPPEGLIMHSDRGSQYASDQHRRLIQDYGMIQSMSRRANCWDNGVPRTPQGDVLREMRVWPLGIGLQDRVPNYVELLG